MRKKYWDALAGSFDDEVFDPHGNDLFGALAGAIEAASSPQATAVDLGCGTGRALPRLAGCFRSVLAVDLSPRCLEVARRRCAGLDGVEFLQHDLARPLPRADFDVALCVNVAIMPGTRVRRRVLRNVAGAVRPGGLLILVVPSVESALLSVHRRMSVHEAQGAGPRQAAAAVSGDLGFTARSLRDGIVTLGGARTKHYLREELELLTAGLGHELLRLDRVQYPWSTEIEQGAEPMGAPFPWDWLVVSRRRERSGR
jgi:SAM-dependent methyltransferase